MSNNEIAAETETEMSFEEMREEAENTAEFSAISIRPEQVKFRYIGDVSEAREGIITLATYKDDLADQMRVGVCYTRPGDKFDAEFARAVAMLRIPKTLFPAGTVEAVFEDSRLRARVQKTSAKRRLSEDEREALRAKSPVEMPGVGYYTHEYTYYVAADFADELNRYGFVFDIPESEDGAVISTHGELDIAILEELAMHNATKGFSVGWIGNAIDHALDVLGGVVSDSDDFEAEVDDDGLFKLTQLNTSNAKVDLASVTEGEFFLIATDTDGDRAAASPIFASIDALKG